MELERSERYGSAEEVLEDLRRIEVGAPKPRRPKVPLWAGVSVVILAGLAAGYYWGVYVPGKKGEERGTGTRQTAPDSGSGKRPEPGVTAFGSLLVNTLPDAEIFKMSAEYRSEGPGILLGKSDLNGLFEFKDQMAAGKRMIQVRKENYRDSQIAEVVIEEGRLAVVEVGLQPLPGSLVILSSPSGAEVEIDGKRAGVTPYTAGEQESLKEYRVVVSAAGYRDYAEAFELEAGEDKRLSVTLEKAAGSLRLTNTAAELGRGLVVRVDGRGYNLSPGLVVKGLAPGKHEVELEHPDYENWKGEATIADEREVPLRPEWKPKPGELRLEVLDDTIF